LKKAATIHPDTTLHQFTATEYINDYYYMQPFMEKNDAGCTTLSHALGKRVHPFLAPRLYAIKQEHDTLLRDNAIFVSVKNAVDRITADESVTALVCVNDLVAGLITDYWDFQQIPSRRRPALFGFDNSFTSIRKQISSYEFNTHGEIQNMINHVLYPDTTLFNRNRPVIRLKGTVIERASSESGNCRQKA
jgi:hypothetical protein